MNEETKEQKPEPVKIDLGCGSNKKEGFRGLDKFAVEGVDIVHDMEILPWPIESDSVDELHCSHYIEHCRDLVGFYGEIYRILKKGGTATLIAPYGKNNRAWQDPTHVRAIVEESFFYLDKNFRTINKLTHYLADVDFEYSIVYAGIDPHWQNKSEEARAFAIKHYWNVVMDIQAVLKKR